MLERTVPGLPDDEVRGDELAMSTEAERTLAEFLVSGERGGAERGVKTRGEEATVPDKVLDNLWEPLDLLAFTAVNRILDLSGDSLPPELLWL